MDSIAVFSELVTDAVHFLEEERLFDPLAIDINHVRRVSASLKDCVHCELHRGVNPHVAGAGAEDPDILVLGDFPGSEPEARSRSFNTRAGQLLTKMLIRLGLRKENVFITTVFKCHGEIDLNNEEFSDDIWPCKEFLDLQLTSMKPRVIFALSGTVVRVLLRERAGLENLRGKCYHYCGVPVVVSYHPEDVLREPRLEEKLQEDLIFAMEVAGK